MESKYSAHENTLLINYYKSLGLPVAKLVEGEPFDKNGFMLCVKCGSNSIDDDSPVWQCNRCGTTVLGPTKELIQKLKDKHGPS